MSESKSAMPTYKVRRFPACPSCDSATAVAIEVIEVPASVKKLAKDQPVKECLHCGTAWYEYDRFSREGQHQRVYHIVRHTAVGPWLENVETVTCVLPKPRKRRYK